MHTHASRLAALALSLATVATLAACSDQATEPLGPSLIRNSDAPGFPALGDFQRFGSIGTSITMGVCSDGVNAACQRTSWVAQLANLAKRPMTLPLISAPGCAAPIVGVLAQNQRQSGEPIGIPFLSRQCAPNEPGVQLPTQNLAIDGARTIHALTATPENPDPGHATQYSRVLPPGMAQIDALEVQNPKIASVEFGANEVLPAVHGIFHPAVVTPVAVWQPQYHELVGRVAAVVKHAVLVGLVNDVRSFPSFRTGDEIWNARATFAPLYVSVSSDCQGSTNLVFVAARIPAAAAQGASNYANQLPPAVFSCVNAPSTSFIEDYVLDANEVAALNTQIAAMNAIIQDEATKHGFAYFALSALYDDAVRKGPLNAAAIMGTTQPYGPYVSLDGLHPTAEGQRVLADAAAQALNATYHLGIPTSGGATLALFARQ